MDVKNKAYARLVWSFIHASIGSVLLVRNLVPEMSVPEIWESSWLEVMKGGSMQRGKWLNIMLCVCWCCGDSKMRWFSGRNGRDPRCWLRRCYKRGGCGLLLNMLCWDWVVICLLCLYLDSHCQEFSKKSPYDFKAIRLKYMNVKCKLGTFTGQVNVSMES